MIHPVSQAEKRMIRVSSFSKLRDGQQNFFFCLSTTEAWTFCNMNALNPLRFTSHHKELRKLFIFQPWKFLNDKIDQNTNCQVPNYSFCITVNFIIQKLKFCKIGIEDTFMILLSALDRLWFRMNQTKVLSIFH